MSQIRLYNKQYVALRKEVNADSSLAEIANKYIALGLKYSELEAKQKQAELLQKKILFFLTEIARQREAGDEFVMEMERKFNAEIQGVHDDESWVDFEED